jgi:murein DD-endopeptidase MepM/ murein hydrolase activator NlpD
MKNWRFCIVVSFIVLFWLVGIVQASDWQNSTMDSIGVEGGAFSPLTLDGSGNPHISSYDATNGHLKYAENQGISDQIKSVLSPVSGPLEIVNTQNNCTPSKWCFNQHMEGEHVSGGGIGQSNDTFAWDANLDYPDAWDSDYNKPVYAVAPGVVPDHFGSAMNAGGNSGQLLIEHSSGENTWWSGYLHVSSIQVTLGQQVTESTLLGYINDISNHDTIQCSDGIDNNGNGLIDFPADPGCSSAVDEEEMPFHLHFVVYNGSNTLRGGLKSFNATIIERKFSSQSKIGVYRTSAFSLRNSNSAGNADLAFNYGIPGDTPLVGDWDGNGVDTVGIYRTSAFYLRNSNNAGNADLAFNYGIPGDTPLVGDWDGNSVDTIGIYRTSAFYLRNSNNAGNADLTFNYGIPGDTPLVGDWDGDGNDTVGIYRNGAFYLRNSNNAGNADLAFIYGIPGDTPLVGNWNGM